MNKPHDVVKWQCTDYVMVSDKTFMGCKECCFGGKNGLACTRPVHPDFIGCDRFKAHWEVKE